MTNVSIRLKDFPDSRLQTKNSFPPSGLIIRTKMKRRELLKYTGYFAGAALSAPLASALLTGCKRDEEMLEEGIPTRLLR